MSEEMEREERQRVGSENQVVDLDGSRVWDEARH